MLFYIHTDGQRLTSPNYLTYVTYAGKDFIHTYTVGRNITFSYALCDQHLVRFKRKCLLSQEVRDQAGSTYKKTCLTRLTVKESHIAERNKYSLVQVGQDSLVLAWNEGKTRREENETTCGTYQEFLKIRVIDMRSCSHRETKITADGIRDVKNRITSLNIVPLDDGNFELVYRNVKHCGKHLRCTRGYDSEDHKFSRTVGKKWNSYFSFDSKYSFLKF